MDRNLLEPFHKFIVYKSLSARRAWIEISFSPALADRGPRSLSARRAWIEILISLPTISLSSVALREESVDRNVQRKGDLVMDMTVALREESVDRNKKLNGFIKKRPGRSPRGERG